jgi:hypothetical protein
MGDMSHIWEYVTGIGMPHIWGMLHVWGICHIWEMYYMWGICHKWDKYHTKKMISSNILVSASPRKKELKSLSCELEDNVQ